MKALSYARLARLSLQNQVMEVQGSRKNKLKFF